MCAVPRAGGEVPPRLLPKQKDPSSPREEGGGGAAPAAQASHALAVPPVGAVAMKEALDVEWDRLVVSVLWQDWGLQAA